MEIAKTKDDLPPDTNLECPICYDNINLDEVRQGVPNCLICENGHRMHYTCFTQTDKHECPVCRNKKLTYCKTRNGYSYVERKGGKKRKTRKSKRKTRKSKRKTRKNKRKTRKSRNKR